MAIGVGATLFALSPIGTLFEERTGPAWLFSMRGPVEPPPEVVVVAIDQRSADYLQLPSSPREWPRSLHGRLIQELKRRGASVIVFDLKFERPQSPNEDDELAGAIGNFGRVLLVQGRDRVDRRDIGGTGPLVDLPLQQNLAAAALGIAPFPVPKLPSGRVSQAWAFHGNAATLPSLAMLVHQADVYKSWLRLLRKQGILIGGSTLDGDISDKAAFSTEVTSVLRLASKKDPEFVGNMRQSLATEMPADASSEAMRALSRLDPLVHLYKGPDSLLPKLLRTTGNNPHDILLRTGQRRCRERAPASHRLSWQDSLRRRL
jgi:adenylate cyclase